MHPAQLPLPPALEEVWLLALADAELTEDEVYLYATELSIGQGTLAKHLRRGLIVDSELPLAIDAELNDDPLVWSDRVLLRRADRPIEVDAALLRHELEHVLQCRADERLVPAHDVTYDVIALAGEGSAHLYTKIPMELRANGAAGAFVRGQFGDVRIDELAASLPHRALLRTPISGPPAEPLMDEMISFLVEHRELCRQWDFFKFALDQVGRDVYDEWQRQVAVVESAG